MARKRKGRNNDPRFVRPQIEPGLLGAATVALEGSHDGVNFFPMAPGAFNLQPGGINEMTAADVHRAVRIREEELRLAAIQAEYLTQRRDHEEMTRRHGRQALNIRVDVSADPYQDATVITTTFGDGYHIRNFVRREHQAFEFTERAQQIAREQARQYADEIMTPQIFDRLIQATRTPAPIERYSRGPGIVEEAIRHARDVVRGAVTGPNARPETPTPIPGLDRLPKQVTLGALRATLLADDVMIWDEGVKMGHCLGKSYTNRIMAGGYLAYHIDIVGSTNGVTLGFTRYAKLGRNITWQQEQLKGKANTTKYNSRPDIKEFCKHIETLLNGGQHDVRQEQDGDSATISAVNRDDICDAAALFADHNGSARTRGRIQRIEV